MEDVSEIIPNGINKKASDIWRAYLRVITQYDTTQIYVYRI